MHTSGERRSFWDAPFQPSSFAHSRDIQSAALHRLTGKEEHKLNGVPHESIRQVTFIAFVTDA